MVCATLCWREWIRTIGPAEKARSPRFSRRDLLHRAANASRGRENVMQASHRRIGRECCGVFCVKAVRRLMAPAGIDRGDEAVRNGAAQDDLFAALLDQHPLAC